MLFPGAGAFYMEKIALPAPPRSTRSTSTARSPTDNVGAVAKALSKTARGGGTVVVPERERHDALIAGAARGGRARQSRSRDGDVAAGDRRRRPARGPARSTCSTGIGGTPEGVIVARSAEVRRLEDIQGRPGRATTKRREGHRSTRQSRSGTRPTRTDDLVCGGDDVLRQRRRASRAGSIGLQGRQGTQPGGRGHAIRS